MSAIAAPVERRSGESASPFRLSAIMGALAAVIIGAFMAMLDNTAVNVALPTLVGQFSTDIATIQWVVTGYTLAQAAVIPLAGWLCDRVGARRVYLTAVALFVAGSALCAVSQSTAMLVICRVLQGLGGGCILPIGLTYIFRLSPPEKRGIVMGTYGIPIVFAPAIGPTLAGWLVQFADWRWVFIINLPLGLIALIAGSLRLPALERQQVAALDLRGILLGPLAFVSLAYAVSEVAYGWSSPHAIAGFVVGAAALAAFIGTELRSPNPLLELRVFRSRDFTFALLTQWVAQMALFGAVFLVPLFLENVRHYEAFATGLALLPQALGATLFMPIGGKIFDRFGIRWVLIGGLALVGGASLMLTTLSESTEARDLILPLFLRGAGMGLMMMTLNTYMLSTAPRELIGRVTALSQALSNVIASLSIAGLATLLQSRANYHIDGVIAAFESRQINLNEALTVAWAKGFDDTLMVQVLFAAGGIAMAFTLRPSRR